MVFTQNLQEQKQQLEIALKNAKTNEKLMISEMEHIRTTIEDYDKQKLPSKDAEIKSLNQTIKNVIKYRNVCN